MAISLQLIEAFNLEGISLTLRRRNIKKYDTTHSLVDAIMVTNSANKYINKIISRGFISCSGN